MASRTRARASNDWQHNQEALIFLAFHKYFVWKDVRARRSSVQQIYGSKFKRKWQQIQTQKAEARIRTWDLSHPKREF